MPNIGAAVRARWTHVVADRPLLDTAFAVEAVNDELVFIVGPTLTTLLATAVDPLAGLVTAGVAALVGTWALVAQRAHRAALVVDASVTGDGRRRCRGAALLPLVGGAVSLGVILGGCEVADDRARRRARPPEPRRAAAGGLGPRQPDLRGRSPARSPRSGRRPTRYRLGSVALTAAACCPCPSSPGCWTLGVLPLPVRVRGVSRR